MKNKAWTEEEARSSNPELLEVTSDEKYETVKLTVMKDDD